MLSQLFFSQGRGKGRVHLFECGAALGFVGQLAAGNFECTCVGGIPYALLEVGVVGLVAVGALGVCAFDLSGEGKLCSNLNFDRFVGDANGLKHFGFRHFVHFTFNHHYAVS